MKAILDTSVLISDSMPPGIEAAISVVSITELHFGLLVVDDADERARRADRLSAGRSRPATSDLGGGPGRA